MKKTMKILLVVLLSIMTLPVYAKAEDAFYANDKVNLTESKESTMFIAGNNVNVSSNIEGISFVAGNNLELSSTQDYLFAAGNSINVENVNTKDAFIAGNLITVTSSNIRDLFVAGQTIRIDSDISRNAYLAGDTVTINGRIEGDVLVAADKIRVGKNAVITGTIKYPEDADISISENATVEKQKSYKNKNVKVELTWQTVVMDFIYSYLALLVIGLIILCCSKREVNEIKKEKKDINNVITTTLIGLVALIVVPIASIIIMITIIGVPLSIIVLLLYGILIYLANLLTAYYFGNWFLKDAIKNEYVLLIVSLLILKLLEIIPGIGSLISLVSICFGLGMSLKFMKEDHNPKKNS